MPQRRSKPLTWKIKGTSDTLDGSTAFTGAMMALQNLIPDPSTDNLWQCRPAATVITQFGVAGDPFSSGFGPGFGAGSSSPSGFGNISVFKIVGNFAYGMIASLTAFPGFDVPFCVNLLNNSIVNVAGVNTSAQLPATPLPTGAWTPPQMDVIGTKLMVTHPGFTGASNNYIGWFDISTPGSPVWHAGNLTGGFVSFTIAPIAVKQFGNRAYYIHNNPIQPAVIFSDPLNATNVTNANQILTFNDNVPLTALGALPLSNQLGGIIQSLMVFKNVTTIFQILGDAATSNLSINTLNVATGTLAPNSICPTSVGLAFVAPDGVRIIDFDANVSQPIGVAGAGVCVPFIYSSVPSRIAGACNGMVLRMTTENGNVSGAPEQEYWYDFGRKIWSGPHTFPASLIQPYQDTFVMSAINVTTGAIIPATLWRSDKQQSLTSTFVENGTQMTWSAQTCLLPDTEQMTNNAMTETTVDMSLPSTMPPVSVIATDQFGVLIDSVSIRPPPGPPATIWNNFTWGNAVWSGGIAAALAPFQVPWHFPIVFARAFFTETGQSQLGFKLGTLHLRYQILGIYTNTAAAA